MIEQNSLGLQWIEKEFGNCSRPHSAWQIDPFGHSRGQAEIFAKLGYDSGIFYSNQLLKVEF